MTPEITDEQKREAMDALRRALRVGADRALHRLRSGGVSMNKRCQIEVVFSPPRPDLANVPSSRRDPGGFIFRLRREDGGVCVSGSFGTLDPFKALERAQHVALRGGFEEWRVWNAGGAYVKLPKRP